MRERRVDGLILATARRKDGLIEALEAPGMAFFLGVQWHPELGEDDMDPLFAVFVESARHSTALSSK